jgi:anti-sigma factor RsiW
MVTCKDVFEEASDFHDGFIDAERHDEFARHLESCAACGNFYRSFDLTIARAREAVLVDPPAEVVEAVAARVRRELGSKSA